MHPFSGSALFSLKKIAGKLFHFYCVLFHVSGLYARISVERIVRCLFVLWRTQRGGGGGAGGSDPPRKSQVIWVSTGNKQLDPPPPPPGKVGCPPLEFNGPPLEP